MDNSSLLKPRALSLCVAGIVTSAVLAACNNEPPADSRVGFTVRPVEFPGASGSGQPRLSTDVSGTPILSWLEPAGSGHALRYARFESGAFAAPHEVTRRDDLFVNWADQPSVQPITEELWAAHWLQLVPEAPGAYHAITAISADGGRTWSSPMQLNDDSAHAEHGFVRLFAWDGAVGAFWLDGRELAEWSFDKPDELLGTSLRVARLDETGAVTAREIVDDIVCDCCQPGMAMTSEGPVVAYRDRTPEELRDIVVRRYANRRWDEPVAAGKDGWRIEGCPVNGPAIAAHGQHVTVAWFTAADDMARVRLARSTDGARSFGFPIEVDGAGALGQVGLLLDEDGTATVTWWRRAPGGGTDLAARNVTREGVLGEIKVVAHSAAAQPLDVPQIVRAGDAMLVAWTDVEGAGTVRTLLVENLP